MTNLHDKLYQMKLEIAMEFGIENYDVIDKGELSARTNGKIGGEMTKRLIELGKMQLAQVSQRELVPVTVKREEVKKKQLLLPLPIEYNQEPLPIPSHYSSPTRPYYH